MQDTSAKQLKEKLFHQRKNAGILLDDQQIKKADEFSRQYRSFLDAAKTEREATSQAVAAAEKMGFEPFSPKKQYQPGDRVYCCNRGKSLILAVIGKQPLEQGARVIASHVDSPRFDIKPNPLYEESELAFFKTHYYGGFKKYQWTTIPMALHGVIIKSDQTRVEVRIGEEEGEPVFCITDLLPHLADDQMKRPSKELVRGEEMNLLVGSLPFRDDSESQRVKLLILSILHQKYGIVERDLQSAELTAVPAFPAREVGFDRSMIGGYGQDDRVCAYPALEAILGTHLPPKTAVVVLADKEEIGSTGNTGLHSQFFRYFIDDLAESFGTRGRTVLSHSTCLSADVSAAFDPSFPDTHDKYNAALCGYGVTVMKYSGSRGKAGTSDASAEFMNEVTRLLDRHKITWQSAELGKVDGGGGGTVAMFLADLNMDVLDIGVPVLSMHAPFEVVSKLDLWESYRAFSAFLSEQSLA